MGISSWDLLKSQGPLNLTKISLLQLARELKNVQQLCKTAGIARSSFNEIRKAYEQFDRQGLRPKQKRRPRMPNETPPEIVENILGIPAIPTTVLPISCNLRASARCMRNQL